jgi:hypothetical protein
VKLELMISRKSLFCVINIGMCHDNNIAISIVVGVASLKTITKPGFHWKMPISIPGLLKVKFIVQYSIQRPHE